MKRIELSHRLTKSQGKFISVAICAVTGMLIYGSAGAAPKMVITAEHTATADSNNEINGNEGGGFFVESGKLNISNTTVTNFTTKGGDGSGGGAGLGGAIFINSGAEAVLENVNFSGNSAVGGDGGKGTVGGSLNGIIKNQANTSGTNGSDAKSGSAYFNGGNGLNGLGGDDGSEGGKGGKGGIGADGSAVTADTIKAAADAAYDVAMAIKNAADGINTGAGAAAAAANPLTASLAPYFGTKTGFMIGLLSADSAKAAVDIAYVTAITIKVLEDGAAGNGGAGGNAGNGGNGLSFLGGGQGGEGGKGGDAHNNSRAIGGAGGNGGTGGIGGFGAGGGQGGDGGKDGNDGHDATHAKDPGDGGNGGKGGFAAGKGGMGNGGNDSEREGGAGGSGLGGSIFVGKGGKLTIKGDTTFDRGNVSGGSGDDNEEHLGEAGKEAGSDLFMMKGSTVVLDAGKGKTITFNGSIADDSKAGLDGASNNSGKGADLTIKSGLVVFNADNTYTGQTKIEGGALHAEDGTGIHEHSNINFTGNHDGGVLETKGTFDRYTGTAKDRVQWTGSGGFAANGGDLEINLNGGSKRTWGKEGFVGGDNALIFGSDTATDNVTFKNAIDIDGKTATILVNTGSAEGKHAQMDGVLSNGSLVVGDASHKGELILNAANTYADGTTIKAGSLQLSSKASLNKDGAVIVEKDGQFDLTKTGDQAIGTLAGAGKVALAANTLTLNQAGNTTFSGEISGEKGNVIKQGVGTLTLSGDNTYLGQTQIKAGTVTLDGSLASQSVDVFAGAILNDNQGGLHQDAKLNNDGTINLNADDTVASLTNTGTINGSNTLTAKTYALNHGSVINAKLGTGELTANGTVTLTGTSAAEKVNVASGVMTLSSGERLLDSSDVIVDGKLVMGGNETIGTLAGSKADGVLELSGAKLTLQQNKDTTFAGHIDDSQVNQGSVLKQGSATLTLTGDSHYLGNTVIETGGITLDGTLASLNIDVQKDGTLTNNQGGLSALAKLNNDGIVNQSSDDTVKTLINTGTINASANGKATLTADTYALNEGSVINANLGTGVLTANGKVQLNGTSSAETVNVETGVMTLGSAERLLNSSDVTVNAKLIMGGDETIGTLAGAKTGVVELSGSKLTLEQNHNTTFNGVIQDKDGDKGSLLKHGTGEITLTGDHTFSGDTTVDGGKVQLNGTLVSKTVHVKNGTMTLGSAERLLNTADITVDDKLIMGGNETVGTLAGTTATAIVDLNGGKLTLLQEKDTRYAGQINDATSTQGSVLKKGKNTLTLAGNSHYLGDTTIEQGGITLDGTLESLNLDVQKDGTLSDNKGGLSTLAKLNNDGIVNQNSDDTIKTLVNTGTINASTDGKATLTADTYALNEGSIINANLGTGVVTANGKVALNGTSTAQTVNVASGTMTLGSAERLLDTSDVSVDGKLVLGGNETIGTLAGKASGIVDLNAGKLTLQQNTDTLFAGQINDSQINKGSVVKQGTATITLTGASHYIGETRIESGGITLDGSLASLKLDVQKGSTLTNNQGGLADLAQLNNDGTVNLNHDDTIAALINTGTIHASTDGKATLTAKTYALNDHSLINANLGSGSLIANGNVALNGTSAAESVKIDSGITTLGAADRLLDTAKVSIAGKLVLGGNETIAQLSGLGELDLNAGKLTLQQNTDSLFSGQINDASGKGSFVKQGSGMLSMSGVSSYKGATRIEQGAITLSGKLASQDIYIAKPATLNNQNGGLSTTAKLSNDGTLKIDANQRIASLSNSGHIIGNGTLSASNYALNDGSVVNANLGDGTLETHGKVTLNGTSAAENVHIFDQSALTLGAAERLNKNATVQIDQTGEMILAGGDQTIKTLNGSGTVNSTTHKLTVTNGGVFTGKINAAKTDLISTGGKLDISGNSNTDTDTIHVQNNSQVAVSDKAVVTTGTATVDKGGVLTLNDSNSLKYDVLTGGGTVSTISGLFTNSKKVQGFLSFDGDFRNEGTLAPGNSPGVINIAGNYNEAGVLQSELQNTTPITGHDQLRVAGKITLESNSQLVVQTYGGSAPRLGEVYQILADQNGNAKRVSGHFAEVKFDLDGLAGSNAAVVNAAAVFDVATGQVLTTGLNLPQSTFADLGNTPSQRAAAAALMNIATKEVGSNQIDTSLAAGKNAGEFLTANGATVSSNVERLTPEYYGAISDYALQNKRSMLNLLQARGTQEQNSAYAGYMRSGGQSAGNSHISRNDYYLGAEFNVSQDLKLGSVLTVNNGKLEAHFGSGNVNGHSFTAYLAYQPLSALNVLASVAYAKYSYDLDRSGVSGQITGSTSARGIDASLAASYKAYADQDLTVLTRSNLSHGKVMVDAFNEQGTSHRLQLGSVDANQFTWQLGTSLIWGAKDQPLKLGVDLGIERHFSNQSDDMQSTLAVDQRVTAPIEFAKDRDIGASIGFNANYKLSKDVSLFGKVEYLSNKDSSYSGQTGLNLSF
ncbi:autotransporter-associated beta strand repeat-containing protein [Iodobacter sp. CM08]|uniref:autotransporter-associated beta strand repeat-containing protein n=1 Tax=Iodobacter sp. CM08 TaxID=3085902 RepID=UPI002981AB08|nr:autotransporter-associated beta strand repeat-containing protein [Iodobacter sp. CM08]MDW5418442.1 autotransporter-associated beta strand repeat-containing protein [Iodobacter sp. CM08]